MNFAMKPTVMDEVKNGFIMDRPCLTCCRIAGSWKSASARRIRATGTFHLLQFRVMDRRRSGRQSFGDAGGDLELRSSAGSGAQQAEQAVQAAPKQALTATPGTTSSSVPERDREEVSLKISIRVAQ